jgi:hypothetical protein
MGRQPLVRAGAACVGGLLTVPRRQVGPGAGPGRGEAGGHEHQAWPHRHQPGQVCCGGREHPARVVLHHQHRDPRLPRTDPPVAGPVAGQVHHRHPAQVAQPPPQLRRVAAVLYHQVHPGAGRPQDRGLFRLEVQLVLTPRRRRHERHPQPEPVRFRRRPGRSQPPHHAEPRNPVHREEPSPRRGEQLERRPQHRPRPRRGPPRPRHFKYQRRHRSVQQPGQLPLRSVQPAVQLRPQAGEHRLVRPRQHRPGVPGRQPGQEFLIRRRYKAPRTDPLPSGQHLEAAIVYDKTRPRHGPSPSTARPATLSTRDPSKRDMHKYGPQISSTHCDSTVAKQHLTQGWAAPAEAGGPSTATRGGCEVVTDSIAPASRSRRSARVPLFITCHTTVSWCRLHHGPQDQLPQIGNSPPILVEYRKVVTSSR